MPAPAMPAPGFDDRGRPIQWMVPARLHPLHPVDDPPKADRLAADMRSRGWVGAPIVAIRDMWGEWYALTGTHRLAAATAAGIECPVLDLTSEARSHMDETGEGWRADTTPTDGAAWAWCDAACAVLGPDAAWYGIVYSTLGGAQQS